MYNIYIKVHDAQKYDLPLQIFKGGTIGLDYICELTLTLPYLVRYMMVAQKREEFRKLFDECRVIWVACTETEHETVLFFIKKIHKLSKWYFISINFLNILYGGTALAVTIPSIEPNGTERKITPTRLVYIFVASRKNFIAAFFSVFKKFKI